ncbi:MAG TPA: putative sugar O-methyltransferase [Luteitalea sp.]|nr:putative sugar O-methyltransferase [Luteitalea sp.]
MDIAILRTTAADNHHPSYAQLEYAALLRGARLVAYALPPGIEGIDVTFRGVPLLPVSSVLRMPDVDLLVVPTAGSLELREQLARGGWGPTRVAWYGDERGAALEQLSQGRWLLHRDAEVVDSTLQQRLRASRLQGLGIDDVPDALPIESRLAVTDAVLGACVRARAALPESGPYLVGRNWGNFLAATRPKFYDALAREDVHAMEALLGQCFRNELTTGIFGGRDAFDQFASSEAAAIGGLRAHYNVWRHSVAQPDVQRLGWPAVGNPFGVWVDQVLVHPNTMLNDHRASMVADLVGHLPHPVVAEIGGGYGGFGRQWAMLGAPGTYLNFDLPENLLVAAHFLVSAHPDRRVKLFTDPSESLDHDVLSQYDVVLMPHFMLPRLAERSVDVFMNFISLSEMSCPTIAEYLGQVARVTRGYFYQENLLDNGQGYEFYPVSVFPSMPEFRRVFSTPSRWPFFSAASPAHSHTEQLLIRRDLEVGRYLTATPAVRTPDMREVTVA